MVTHVPTPENLPLGQTLPGVGSPAFQLLRARGILKRVGSELRLERPRYLSSMAEGPMELPKVS